MIKLSEIKAHVHELMKYPGLEEETMEITISTSGMSYEQLQIVASLEPGDIVRYNRIVTINVAAAPGDGMDSADIELLKTGGICRVTQVSTRNKNYPIAWVEFIAEDSMSNNEMDSLYANHK